MTCEICFRNRDGISFKEENGKMEENGIMMLKHEKSKYRKWTKGYNIE